MSFFFLSRNPLELDLLCNRVRFNTYPLRDLKRVLCAATGRGKLLSIKKRTKIFPSLLIFCFLTVSPLCCFRSVVGNLKKKIKSLKIKAQFRLEVCDKISQNTAHFCGTSIKIIVLAVFVGVPVNLVGL